MKRTKLLSATTLLVIFAIALALLLPLAMGNIVSASTLIKEYPVPTANSRPHDIAAGPDGNVWFTEWNGTNINNVGKITPSGKITEYHLHTSNSGLFSITAGPDGNLWFTEGVANKIGKITTSGSVTEYHIPTSNSGPLFITAGPDGNLWFTESDANKIGKITTSGSVTEYHVPTTRGNCTGITAGPDGNVWFTEVAGNQIARITPSGDVTEYHLPTASGGPYAITTGPDGNLWFTEWSANQIGMAQPTIPPNPTITSTFYFAEGTCRPNFDPYICIQNPGGKDASVTITYMKGNGTTDSQTLTVAKNSRNTVRVKDKLGEANDTAHDFSAKVECTNGQQIIAERPMYFNYNGWTGGHDVVGFTP